MDLLQIFSSFMVWFVEKKKNHCLKLMKNMSVSTAVLCLGVCVFEVMNEAGTCGRSVHDAMGQALSAALLW